ncbi:MAG: exosortase C-terminal domain/associated protein EpsI [Bryobacteraceae bacterium]
MDLGISRLLASRQSRILALALAAQATLFYTTSRSENVPEIGPLRDFPVRAGDWRLFQEGYVDKETQAVLQADDTLTREYVDSRRRRLNLFIAFFKSQRTGKAPHSPKNCLPGAGWEATEAAVVDIAVDGAPAPIRVNRYLVAKGEYRSVVLYWYQSRDRVIASEYAAKVWLVADALRYNRSDTALVKVTVPFVGDNAPAATDVATRFVQAAFPEIRRRLPR